MLLDAIQFRVAIVFGQVDILYLILDGAHIQGTRRAPHRPVIQNHGAHRGLRVAKRAS